MFTLLAEIRKCRHRDAVYECCNETMLCGSFGRAPTLFVKDCTNTIYAYNLRLNELRKVSIWTDIFPIYSMTCDKNNNLYLLNAVEIRRVYHHIGENIWYWERLVQRKSMSESWPDYFINDTYGNIYVVQEQQTYQCSFTIRPPNHELTKTTGTYILSLNPVELIVLPPDIIDRFYQAGGDKCITYPGLEEPEGICYSKNSVLVRFFHSKWRCSIARWDGQDLTILTPPFLFRYRKLYIDPEEMMIYSLSMRAGGTHRLRSYRYGVKSLLTLSLETIQQHPNWTKITTILPIELRERLHIN